MVDPLVEDVPSILSGRVYPEDTVSVFMDEDALYEIGTHREELELLEETFRGIPDESIDADDTGILQADRDKYRAAMERLNAAKDRLRASELKILIRGVPKTARDNLQEAIKAEYPVDPEDQEATQRLQVDQFLNQSWALHVVKITRAATEEEIDNVDAGFMAAFRTHAPDSAVAELAGAISKLYSGANAGFEFTTQSADFLSQP